MSSKAKEGLLKRIKDSGVKLITLQFVDIFGTAKGFTIPTEHLEESLSGLGFDGSSIEGFVRIYESDMLAIPDLTTFRVLPWRPQEKKEGRIICDLYRPEGRPFEGDPRYILKKTLEEAEASGFVYNVGPELEFFLFKVDEAHQLKPAPHDMGSYFDLSPLDISLDIRREATFALQEMGLDVERGHHEVAPGQHEIDFKFTDALTTADNVITYKSILKAVASDHDLLATFMPKPIAGINGSGMHTHQSLCDAKTGRNAFFDPGDEYSLSELAYRFIGGQLKHAREMSLVLSPTTNSYKRLVPGYEAPTYICWGRRNRSALIRVPEYHPGREKETRLELRCPDPSCNPYLALTVMLKAGLDGIKSKIQPPNPVEEDVYEFDERKLAKFYIETLPSSLGEAIEEFEKSKLMREALGEFTFRKYIEAKKKEWNEYNTQVTGWELKKYLDL